MSAVYAHTNINTPNWKALADFYVRVFDAVVSDPNKDVGGEWFDRVCSVKGAHVTGCAVALPGYGEKAPEIEFFTWEIEEDGFSTPINGKGFGHLAFEVDDVYGMAEKVKENGGSLLGTIENAYFDAIDKTLTICYAKDPDGNAVELMKWGDGKIQD